MARSPKNHIGLRDALDQYTTMDGIVGPTLYEDPFKLPPFYHPTYEATRDRIRFNPNLTIAGFKCSEFKSLDDLYELMPYQDYLRNVKLGYQSLLFRNRIENVPDNVLHFSVEACFKLRGKGGKLYYYKRTSNENGMVNGSISSAVSYWEDIGYLKPQQLGYWKLEGKNTNYFDFDVPQVQLYQDVFTSQEAKILSLLARGFSSPDIGRALKISRHTVDTHRRNMLRKLEVANTPELVDIARDMDLIK